MGWQDDPVVRTTALKDDLLGRAKSDYPYLSKSGLLAVQGQDGGTRKLEYWPRGEPGNNQYPRPSGIPIGSAGVEIFDKDVSTKDILADYVSHEAVKSDPKLRALYENFAASVPDETMRKRYAYHKTKLGETRDFETWKETSGMPEYFRGYTFDQWQDAKKFYSPQQLQKLDEIRQYLGVTPAQGVASQQAAAAWESDPVVSPAPSQPRSPAQEVGRQGALAGRAVLEGLGDLASIPANALAGLGNLLLELDRRIAGNADRAVIPNQAQAVPQALNAAGVAAPENDTEQLVNTIGRRATGAAATMGTGMAMQGAQGVTGAVGQTMASNPVIQAVGSATGPIAGEMARQSGAGPVGQIAADLAGSVVPGVVTTGAQATTRAGFRGGEAGRQTVARNEATFRRAGTAPSVGQATERRFWRGTESLLSRVPGGAGPVVHRAETQADEVAAAIERRAAQLTRRTSAEQAGRAIERSVRGPGGFLERFRATQGQLFGEVDAHIPDATPVAVTNTQRTLTDMTRAIPGAAATSQRLINQRIAAIADDLATDAQNGSIPYQALRQLRTMIGQEMDNGLVSDVPAAQWRRLYGALSQDLEAAATAAGPQASAAYMRANNYTRAGMRRVEAIESVINKNGGPEAIFRAATTNTKEGATTLRAVMQSVDPEGQRMITATVLRRLGLAKAGVQGELGDRFSTETFLTNWNLLSREAKRALFDRHGPAFRADMDALANFAANLREGSQVFRNPSGTQQATAQVATVAGLVTSLLTGQWESAAMIGGAVGGANLSSRLMTNPRFVHWLAQTTRFPAGAYSSAVNSLASTAQKTGDMDLARAAALLEQQEQYTKDKGDGKRQNQ